MISDAVSLAAIILAVLLYRWWHQPVAAMTVLSVTIIWNIILLWRRGDSR